MPSIFFLFPTAKSYYSCTAHDQIEDNCKPYKRRFLLFLINTSVVLLELILLVADLAVIRSDTRTAALYTHLARSSYHIHKLSMSALNHVTLMGSLIKAIPFLASYTG